MTSQQQSNHIMNLQKKKKKEEKLNKEAKIDKMLLVGTKSRQESWAEIFWM